MRLACDFEYLHHVASKIQVLQAAAVDEKISKLKDCLSQWRNQKVTKTTKTLANRCKPWKLSTVGSIGMLTRSTPSDRQFMVHADKLQWNSAGKGALRNNCKVHSIKTTVRTSTKKLSLILQNIGARVCPQGSFDPKDSQHEDQRHRLLGHQAVTLSCLTVSHWDVSLVVCRLIFLQHDFSLVVHGDSCMEFADSQGRGGCETKRPGHAEAR